MAVPVTITDNWAVLDLSGGQDNDMRAVEREIVRRGYLVAGEWRAHLPEQEMRVWVVPRAGRK